MFKEKEILINSIKHRLYTVITLVVFSISTYVSFLVRYGEFDFGILLESLTLIFTIVSVVMISKEKVSEAKMITWAAIVPDLILVIFDICNCFVFNNFYYDFRMNFITMYLPIIILFDVYRFLRKIDLLEEKLQKDTFYGKEAE